MLKVNFRCHTPKKRTFWEVENLPFFENISFAGLKSKFLSTQQKFYMSPTHPINMSSIGLKLMKLEQSTFSRFFFGYCNMRFATKILNFVFHLEIGYRKPRISIPYLQYDLKCDRIAQKWRSNQFWKGLAIPFQVTNPIKWYSQSLKFY